MKPVDQDLTLEHGNCWSACMASITQLPIERFARFHELYSEWGKASEAGGYVSWAVRRAYVEELHRMGWHVQILNYGTIYPIPRGYSIASGPGPRGVDHSCVALDGTIVHDPHPSRAGLVRIESFEVLVPLVGVLDEDVHDAG